MKTLIWKEWREARLTPVAVVGLFVAVNLVWMLLKYPSSWGRPDEPDLRGF